MERRADRALPPLQTPRRFLRTIPLFLGILAASTLAIFNYQKSSSSVVTSTLYALRTSPRARDVLGDEIYFRAKIPWISGELNQLHGRIDIRFWVKGKRGEGLMRFKSVRRGRQGSFETQEWSLETKDGQKIELLEPTGRDPFKNPALPDDALPLPTVS
ncbi:MAG: hypothetical protein M1832_003979 [Thelocarpon impressellum]|nr:MAG: hypothetical protein M1832_003979 [Thelocarpon impressellum]